MFTEFFLISAGEVQNFETLSDCYLPPDPVYFEVEDITTPSVDVPRASSCQNLITFPSAFLAQSSGEEIECQQVEDVFNLINVPDQQDKVHEVS